MYFLQEEFLKPFQNKRVQSIQFAVNLRFVRKKLLNFDFIPVHKQRFLRQVLQKKINPFTRSVRVRIKVYRYKTAVNVLYAVDEKRID